MVQVVVTESNGPPVPTPQPSAVKQKVLKPKGGPLSLSQAEFDGMIWRVSPMTAKVGFPLKISLMPNADTEPSEHRNQNLDPLFTEYNPYSNNFGQVALEPVFHKQVVARCDGKDLDFEHFVFTMQFCIKVFQESRFLNYAFMDEKEKMAVRMKALKHLDLETYKLYFEWESGKRRAEGDPRYFLNELPSQKSSPKYCGSCRLEEHKDGAKLLVCGQCMGAFFCNRECQVKLWKMHKIECKKVAKDKKEGRDREGDEKGDEKAGYGKKDGGGYGHEEKNGEASEKAKLF